MLVKKLISLILIFTFAASVVEAGIKVIKSSGMFLIEGNGVTLTGADGITLNGADGYLSYISNGVTLTGADGTVFTGANGVTLTGADGATYTGPNGVTLTGADGVTLTGADGITLTGADGVTLTGADGTIYTANSFFVVQPNGVTLTGADGITITGADGFNQPTSSGVTLTGADGITLTPTNGVTLTGADSITGVETNGTINTIVSPAGVTLTGADGITITAADNVSITGASGLTLTGVPDENNNGVGLQSIDLELGLLLNQMTDDSNVNTVIVYHQYPTAVDLLKLQQLGVLGGTSYRVLPMVSVTATRAQLLQISRLPEVRSIYGNRTLKFNSDPFFNNTGIQRVAPDTDLQTHNGGLPITGRDVTVAVLDTGVNSQHNDLTGKVIQNVRLFDSQSTLPGFHAPAPVENLANTDPVSGHGTFVSGIIAASGASSSGKFSGVAPGAKILGLSAGDLNLSYILSGFDYLLDRGASYNVRVVNCSFSSNTIFDFNDPVNIATKMLTGRGVNIVFSAGNSGAGNGTLNPYATAPWVISVGATDDKGKLAGFSSRGVFGARNQKPSLSATGVNVVSLRGLGTQNGTLSFANGADATRLTPAEMPYYTTADGTSFSAPQVSGAIALMLEANPNLTPAEIKEILQRSASPMPQNFSHEAGAGILNTYAAVLEAAFPSREMGLFRSIFERKQVKFTTSIPYTFNGTVNFGSTVSNQFSVLNDTIQAGAHISWEFSTNDLDLKLFDINSNLIGHSNYLNAPGLTGRREKIILDNPQPQTLRATVAHTGNVGTTQKYYGAVETTRAQYGQLPDIQSLPPETQAIVKESLRAFLMLPEGANFNPYSSVTRAEFTATLVRSGRVPQYLAGAPMFSDVRGLVSRSAAESAQTNFSGKLIYDASDNGVFRPYNPTTRLVVAVALVKAAKLEHLTTTAVLPSTIRDSRIVPKQWRGYAAVALQKGFLSLEKSSFKADKPITRLDLAKAMTEFIKLTN